MNFPFFGELRDNWDRVLGSLRAGNDIPIRQVEDLVERVRERGLKEVLKLTEKFDGISLFSDEIYVEPESGPIPNFVEESFSRLLSCARSLLENSECHVDGFSTSMEWLKGSPPSGKVVNRVGIYVPGGNYPLISSLLMAIAPARAAGVEEFVVATPPRNYKMIEYASAAFGVKEFLKVGGAQAIASLAYGLPEIGLRPVDMIVGPGNSYVTAAKALVSRDVKIDLLAGPSEVLILSDERSPIELVALDMLAQAEHGSDSIALTLTTSREYAFKLRAYLLKYLHIDRFESLKRKSGILYGKKEDLVKFSEVFMPEHLEIFGEFRARMAGAVFENVGVVFGDYGYTGANHILPTGGTLLERPGLSPFSFFREFNSSYSYKQVGSLEAQASVSKMCSQFARLEGLEYHAKAAEIREKLYKEMLAQES